MQCGPGPSSPAPPAVPHVDLEPGLAQPMQPGPQQGRGLHLSGKDPAGGTDEGLHPQPGGPGPQVGGAEGLGEGRQDWLGHPVTGEEIRQGFGMDQVESASPGQEELAPQGRHAVIEVHGGAPHQQDFGGHEPRRAAAHDRDPSAHRPALPEGAGSMGAGSEKNTERELERKRKGWNLAADLRLTIPQATLRSPAPDSVRVEFPGANP